MHVKAETTVPLSPIGLVAGWGRYPVLLAQACRRRGFPVVCLAIKDHADPALRDTCDAFRELGLGKLGAAIRFFRAHGVTVATMAGKVHKQLLFRRFYWWRHLPDWRCVRTFYPHFVSSVRDRKDDTLLGAVVDAFARHGIRMVPATDFLPEVLVKHGVLTRRRPSPREAKDIEFGWRLAKEIGRLDIGQTVAVKGQAVLAVEAVEGTDQCIRRAGELCPAGNFTVVKVAKPQQDMRFDVPTIGPATMRALAEAGASVLAVEADKTVLLDERDAIDFANRHGLVLVALRDGICPPQQKSA